jgi:UDP-N-acetylglucosamine 2-epimerase (non-hydrolysing)
MSRNVFETINGFSYDYTFGNAWDDDDLVLKITSLGIPILSVANTVVKCGGIHLFHVSSGEQWAKKLPLNEELFKLKTLYYRKSSKYIDISENENTLKEKLYCLGLKKPVIVTITGIRPDFIRMSVIFKELDANFHHILIHTGQHYDTLLSDVFFEELSIRKPDYILDTGKSATNHYEQLSYLSTAVPKLLKDNHIEPDLILFLGDSNSACVSLPLKKEGYRIGHIEAGMRSYDKRMLEELNRTVCDHCSDILFVYHEDYKQQIAKENIVKNVHVVGNTIVEPFMLFKDSIMNCEKRKDMILLDIHRPENFNDLPRLVRIFKFANDCSIKFGLPVKMLYFKRLQDMISKNGLDLGKIEMVPLMPYKTYLTTVYHCRFIISDSGTGQEEPALLGTPVVVPRDYSERPQSYVNNCSVQFKNNTDDVFQWINDIETGKKVMKTEWLGDGQTSKHVIEHLKTFFIEQQ